jgi:hypothetical protein
MPYSVYHHYTWDAGRKKGTVLLCFKPTLKEARDFIQDAYRGRFMTGRERVCIHDDTGFIQESYEVDYMAQFEAMPGMKKSYPSSSGSGSYTAQVNTTGIVSCGCMAWTRGFKKMAHPLSGAPYRHCKHTDALAQQLGFSVEVKGQYLFMIDPKIAKAKQKFSVPAAVKATGPQEKFMLMVREYEEAIAIMAALEPSEMYQAAAAVEMAKFKVESAILVLEQMGIGNIPGFDVSAINAKLDGVIGRA